MRADPPGKGKELVEVRGLDAYRLLFVLFAVWLSVCEVGSPLDSALSDLVVVDNVAEQELAPRSPGLSLPNAAGS